MPIHSMRLYAGVDDSLDVVLDLDSGVALLSPELWLYVGQDEGGPTYEKRRLSGASTESSAKWTIPVRDPDYTSFKVYWDAIDPMQPKFAYNATLAVSEKKSGILLKGVNPRIFPCKLGASDPGAGSEVARVVVK